MPSFGLNLFTDNPESREQAGERQGSYYESVAQLPCMPQAVLALIDACGNSEEPIANLSSIVRFDPVLTLNMLAMDPAGEQQRFASLDEVMERIGREGIVGLARSIAFRSHFTSHLDNYESMPAFSQHSLLRAMVARELAESVKYKVPDEAYLAGLLCDIGRLALGSLNIQADGMALLASENELYGSNHIEVGARLLSFLEQISFIPDAVRYHHMEIKTLEEAHELVKIVYAANSLCTDLEYEARQPVSKIATLLHADEKIISGAYEKARENLNTAQQQTSIWMNTGQTGRARRRLAHKVQQYGMLYAYLSQLLNIHSEQELLAAILKISQTLFKPEKQLFFIVDSVNDVLKGMEPGSEHASLVEELKIPLTSRNSFITKTLYEEDPVSIAVNEIDVTNTVLDKQVLGLLNTDRVVYLPLGDARQKIGILLLGFNSNKISVQSHNQDLYKLFADDIGRVIQSFRSRVSPALTNAIETKTSQQDAKRLAHEVSTPLSVVKNYLAVLSAKIGNAHSANEDMRIISEEIERVHSIIRQFANGTIKVSNTQVDVNAVIQDVVKVLHEGLLTNKHVSIKLDLDSSVEPIMTNQDAVKQILINLIKNAVEALTEDDGRIKIRTRGHVRFDDNNYVEIAVVDNGPGIPAAIFEQLFQKVQSTKSGEHSGLGLSIVRSLVNEMNGKISCRTMGEKGTIFHILLPKDIQPE